MAARTTTAAEQQDRYTYLVSLIDDGAELVAGDGRKAELPEPVRAALGEVLRQLGAGRDVTVLPSDRFLTTQQVADLLHVSRPTVVKLLEGGEIVFERPGRHRRVHLAAVQDFLQRRAKQRERVLKQMHEEEPPQRPELNRFVSTR